MGTVTEQFVGQVAPRMNLQARDRIVVLGSGEGEQCRYLAGVVSEGIVVGLDQSEDAVRIARRESAKIENVLYFCCRPEEVPWQDDFFSIAVASSELLLLEDPRMALRQLHRVLIPEGSLWIHLPRTNAHSSQPAILATPAKLEEYVNALRAVGFADAWGELLPSADAEPVSGLVLSGRKQPPEPRSET